MSVAPGLKENSDGRPGSYCSVRVKSCNLRRTTNCATLGLIKLISEHTDILLHFTTDLVTCF